MPFNPLDKVKAALAKKDTIQLLEYPKICWQHLLSGNLLLLIEEPKAPRAADKAYTCRNSYAND